jgi:hypothetical protein
MSARSRPVGAGRSTLPCNVDRVRVLSPRGNHDSGEAYSFFAHCFRHKSVRQSCDYLDPQ